MPKTSKAMKTLLAKKHKPLLALWKNKKYHQLQKPMTFKYPVVKKTAPKLSVCSASEWEGGSNLSGGPGEGEITTQSTKTEMMNDWLLNLFS